MIYKCPECGGDLPVRSFFTTLGMPWSFFDDEGKSHEHDPNISTGEATCWKGHAWVIQFRSSCRVDGCEWNNDPLVGGQVLQQQRASKE